MSKCDEYRMKMDEIEDKIRQRWLSSVPLSKEKTS
jgi:hypothetical protein